MWTRRSILIILTITLASAVWLSTAHALQPAQRTTQAVVTLQNVRNYAPAVTAGGTNYAVDGGLLFAGAPGAWHPISVPDGVIVGAVAVHPSRTESGAADAGASTLYIGAANELAVYRSTDKGQTWRKTPLSRDKIGGVTDLALDAVQNRLYVGTDTAGVFQMQETGVQLLLRTQIPLTGRVVEVAADSTGAGVAFARTDWALYRAGLNGARWTEVTGLGSTPTAIAVANTTPPTAYVGTDGRGLLRSQDGHTWTPFNTGLQMGSGAQLRIDALTIDPARPGVVYAAASQIWGSQERQAAPSEIAFVTREEQAWRVLHTDDLAAPVAALLPISGKPGALYALTTQSRAPLALGEAAEMASASIESAHTVGARHLVTARGSWVIAGLAGFALFFSVISDAQQRHVGGRHSAARRQTLAEHVHK